MGSDCCMKPSGQVYAVWNHFAWIPPSVLLLSPLQYALSDGAYNISTQHCLFSFFARPRL